MNLKLIAFIAAGASLLTGCVPLYPENGERRFGVAVTAVKEAQTLNPGAGRTAPPTGIDGRAAKETMDRYVESFKAPPPNINVLSIGGALTSQ
jgi:hypothetical protein